ncbi:threonine/serine exporter ThrE family protein [Bradyrhizobium sp. STM 3557]|uniref:threonine/serine ThrE exporter family protein n=1 Tax=Bradyrhizobium sp. STM 3557 TaxID=578920 RepID=UPI00388F7930
MTTEDRLDLILEFAAVLYTNGQSTDHVIASAARLSKALGLEATLVPQWGVLHLLANERQRTISAQAAADPTGVQMTRVADAMHAIDEIVSGRMTPESARNAIRKIAQSPPAPRWQFTLAASAGALALGVIFGVEHVIASALIFVSAGAGALLRRFLANLSHNLLLQPFCAALLAGLVGALAVKYQLSSSLRLVAICPCMVLVPGPHFLNSALDFVAGRMGLGIARLAYATLIAVAITAGLLLGLASLGIVLPADPPGRIVPLWQDVIAAGIAVAAYGVFFSMPLKMLPTCIAVGTLAHALRWISIILLGCNVATGAFIACSFVAAVLTPASRLASLPFAAVGFASVVSMIPGVYLFRMASGLLQIVASPKIGPQLVDATISDGLTAVAILLSMGLGLVLPKQIIDYIAERSAPAG